MRQRAHNVAVAARLLWEAWWELVRLAVARWLPWLSGTLIIIALLLAGLAYKHQLDFGTVPKAALDISGTVWWEYGRNDGRLELVFRGHRTRHLDCEGSQLVRSFKYEDGREVIVKPDQASSANALELIPRIGPAKDSEPVMEFSHRYFLTKEQTDGLMMISWVLDAPEGFCKPDGQRRRELVGQVYIPPPKDVFAPMAR